jgi:hypothetical protein
MKQHYLKEVKSGLESTFTQTPEILTETDLDHLPELVKHYIRFSGAVGKPKVNSFKAEFTGKIRKDEQSPWMPFSVEQHSFINLSIRLFWMDATMMHLPVKGFHCFKKGNAFMDIRLLGLIKVQYMDGKEMGISETVTFFNDICVMAPAALIDHRIKWIKTEENRILAEFTDSGITISAWLYFGPNGELVNFISNDRYAFKGKNQMEKFTWQTPLRNYQEMNGTKISTEAELIYEYPEGDFCYGKFEMTALQYNSK